MQGAPLHLSRSLVSHLMFWAERTRHKISKEMYKTRKVQFIFLIPVVTKKGVARSPGRRRPGCGGLGSGGFGHWFLRSRWFRFGGRFGGGTRYQWNLRLLHLIHVLCLWALRVYRWTEIVFRLAARLMLTFLIENHVGLLTFVAQVIPTSSSIAGRALGTRAAMLVWSLTDPVAPAEVNSGLLD